MIQPLAIALDHDWCLLAAMVIAISQSSCSVLLSPLGAPFVKLSVGRDKILFMYYQVDRKNGSYKTQKDMLLHWLLGD